MWYPETLQAEHALAPAGQVVGGGAAHPPTPTTMAS